MTRPSQTNKSSPRHLRSALFFAFSLGLAALGACGDRTSSHGHIINENELERINIGTTTKADILFMLGQPSFDGAFDTQKLYYSSQVMMQPVASAKQTEKRVVYIFTFDKKNVLESVESMNKKDGLQIVHIDDRTPTPGDTFGVLEQVFSNLRRRQSEE